MNGKKRCQIGSGARRGSGGHGERYFLGWQLKSLQGLRSVRLSLPINNQLPFILRDDDGLVGGLPYPFDPFNPFVSSHPTLLTLHHSALNVKLDLATTLLALAAAVASTG